MGKNGELNSKQKRMINALLSSRTLGEACAKVGIGRTTLSRWLDCEDFKRELKIAQKKITDQTIRQLLAAQEVAIQTLRTLAEHAEHESVRRAAANDILAFNLQFRDLEIMERIEVLEENQNEKRYS